VKSIFLSVVVAAIAPVAGWAQTFSVAEMSQGLDMVNVHLQQMLGGYDIDTNVNDLTLSQVAEIIGRIEDGADTKAEIEAAIELARAR
jgi:hypothetical protein